MAMAMWDLLLPPSRWQHVEAWKEFMRTHHKRPVSRDTWNQLLEFVLVRADWRRRLRSLAAVPMQTVGRRRRWAMWAGSKARLGTLSCWPVRSAAGCLLPLPQPLLAAPSRLVQTTAPDFSNFDDSGAWPYLIDEVDS